MATMCTNLDLIHTTHGRCPIECIEESEDFLGANCQFYKHSVVKFVFERHSCYKQRPIVQHYYFCYTTGGKSVGIFSLSTGRGG